MNYPADIRFFQTLKEVCSRTEGFDNTCLAAIERALETGDPLDLHAALRALDELNDPQKEEIMRQAHLRMAMDISAIWDELRGPRAQQRPN
ncbi:hypothetical protein [Leisingera sp.]|uniref:hypothetical protein n=1 Tax=Leisingera sp. TaxID=1879318 RepID=UPI002B27737F|nr:hypothetical protein [Leisingera sp.]